MQNRFLYEVRIMKQAAKISMLHKLSATLRQVVLIVVLIISTMTGVRAQQIDSMAMSLLDEALGFIIEENSGAIYYETIARDLEDPLEIFTLPLYRVDKGGYWFFDGDRFEMVAGDIKALCDGKLLTLIDEENRFMYIDSVRLEPLLDVEGEISGFDEFIDRQFGQGNATYLGEEIVKGKPCHKIKAYMEKQAGDYVLYWIDKAGMQLVLMAEKAESVYTVYEIKSVGKVPEDHSYKIVLPGHEIVDFYGFKVVDMRFMSDFLNSPIEQ